MSGLPVPSRTYFPKPYQDYADSGFVALTDKLDQTFEGILEDSVNFRDIRRVEKMPRAMLNALGYMVVANILDADSDRVAAYKVFHAMGQRRFKSTWFDDVKPKIDAVTSGDSVIFSSQTESDWILLAGKASDPENYWGVMGMAIVPDTTGTAYFPDDWTILAGQSTDPTDYQGILGSSGDDSAGPSLYYLGAFGVDTNMGLDLIGSGTESVIAGNVYIDVGIASLTSDQVAQIVFSISSSVPCYYRIYLGYTQNGVFTVYNGGVIG